MKQIFGLVFAILSISAQAQTDTLPSWLPADQKIICSGFFPNDDLVSYPTYKEPILIRDTAPLLNVHWAGNGLSCSVLHLDGKCSWTFPLRSIFSITNNEAREFAIIALELQYAIETVTMPIIKRQAGYVEIVVRETEYDDQWKIIIDKAGNVRMWDREGDEICLHAQIAMYRWLTSKFDL